MTTNSTDPVKTASEQAGQQKPSVPSAQSPAAPAAPAVKKKHPYEGDSRYEQFKLVYLRLLKPDTLQYDPSYPELILNSSAEEGQGLPLTPFFASRINQTLELVL